MNVKTILKLRILLFVFSLFPYIYLSAQTAPAGLDGSSLRTWVRADKGITTVSGEVLQWNDLSGNGLHFTGTPGESPTLVNSVAAINNRPVIRFNAGGDRQLRGPSAETTFGQDDAAGFAGDVFVVFLQPSGNNGYVVQYMRDNSANSSNSFLTFTARRRGNGVPGSSDPNDVNVFASISPDTWGTASSEGGPLNNNFTDDNYHVARFGFNASNLWVYNIETLAENTGGLNITYNQDAQTGNLGQSPMRLGRSNQYTGDIAEFFVFDEEINPTTYRILQNYFNTQYGFTITNDHFAGAAGYDNDLIGIGKLGANPKVPATFGAGGGLLLSEANNSITDDEWVFSAHDNAGTNLVITDAPGSESRLERIWRIEKTGAADVEIIFDLAEIGLPVTNIGDYKLLSRAGTSGAFTELTPTSANIVGNTIVFEVANADWTSGHYYTLGVIDVPSTWYVFQSGDWDTPATWTTDAAVNPIQTPVDGGVPSPFDNVFIRAAKSVTISTNDKSLQSIRVDGTLNYGTTTGHNFAAINGKGTIRSQGTASNFPAGITTGSIGFGDRLNGGTFEIVGSGNTTIDQDLTLRNLVINKTASTDEVIMAGDITLSGSLDVVRGNFRFGNNTTSRTLLAERNVNVRANGQMSVHNSNARHRFEIKGNFVNDGTVRFTNRTDFATEAERFTTNNTYYTSAATNGIVDFLITANDRNQSVALNNSAYFYRIVVQKGIDPTYEAVFTATNQANFALLGEADGMSDTDITDETQNPNAFALVSGTARLGNNIRIPVLSHGDNYTISSRARFIIDGGYLRKVNGAAIVPYGTLQLNAGTLVARMQSGVTLRGSGNLIINGGNAYLQAFRTSIQGISAQGTYEQNGGNVIVGGTVNSTGDPADPLLNNGNINNSYSLFALNYTGNVFKMRAGTLTIRNAPSLGSGNERGAVFINCDPQNIDVTGGTVIFESNTNAREYRITSRAPFYNAIMRYTGTGTGGNIVMRETTSGTGGGGGTVTLASQPLNVLNDLTLETGNTRTSGSNTYGTYLDFCPAGNCQDLTIGHNLTIGDNTVLDIWSGAALNAGSSTVTFRGTTDAEIYIGDITTYDISLVGYTDPESEQTFRRWEQPFYNLIIDKPDAVLSMKAKDPGIGPTPSGANFSTFKTAAGGKNVNSWSTNLIKVVNEFDLKSGTFDQMDTRNPFGADNFGYSLRLYVDLVRLNGDLFTYEEGVSPKNANVRFRQNAGLITVQSTPNSTIGNVRLNLRGIGGGDTLKLSSGLYIKRLEYRHGKINLGTHNLKIDVLDINFVNNTGVVFQSGGRPLFDSNNIFIVAGNASDGGLSLKWPRTVNTNYSEYWTNNNGYNQARLLYFPIGPDRTPSDATLNIGVTYFHDDPDTFNGEGYVTMRIVDNSLPTVNKDEASGNLLQAFWSVSYEGFEDGLPKVSHVFQYGDSQIGGSTADYVPGRVINNAPYTRSSENETNIKTGGASGANGQLLGNNPRNILIFNGNSSTPNNNRFVNSDGTFPWPNFPGGVDHGFTLEAANYTAGVANYFVGTPQIFYSRESGSSAFWDEGASWNSEAEIAANPPLTDSHAANITQISGDVAGVDYPSTGDIAIIGINPSNGMPHSVRIRNATVDAAEILFAENTPVTQTGRGGFSFLPELVININNPTLNIGQIKGLGVITDRQNRNPSFAGIDIGDYANNPRSYYLIENFQNGPFNYTNLPPILPNLIVTSDGFGNNNRITRITSSLEVNGDLYIVGGGKLRLNDDNGNPNSGDLIVRGDLVLIKGFNPFIGAPAGQQLGSGGGNHPELQFPGSNSGVVPDRTVEVFGDVLLANNNSAQPRIIIHNDGNVEADATMHRLILHGNVNDNSNTNGGVDLNIQEDRVSLELRGNANSEFNRTNATASSIPRFYNIILNKDGGIGSNFAMNTDFRIQNGTTGFQPLEIVNGLFVINGQANPAATTPGLVINSENNSVFRIPNLLNTDASSGSGGLEIQQGTVRVEGDNSGIILDGLLRISGGTLNMATGVGNGNNFIEYSASGNAQIEVSSGTLSTGSNIRRSLTTTQGVLKFNQTGGNVLIGQGGNPNTTRAMFEVLNDGSEFNLTGGNFVVRRGINSTTIPSVRITPDVYNITEPIYLGSTGAADFGSATPSGQNNFGFMSNVPLSKLVANGSNNPIIKLYSEPLQTDTLSIGAGTQFDPQAFNVTIERQLENNGTFVQGSIDQTTIFPSALEATIDGAGTTTFHNFRKSGAGQLIQNKSVTTKIQTEILGGTLNTTTHAFTAEGNVVHNTTHVSDPAAPGFVFGGTGEQILSNSTIGSATATFGVLEINNPADVIIPSNSDNYIITNKLVLNTGIFDIGGTLLTLLEGASVENGLGDGTIADFSPTNMINTNSSPDDNGMRKLLDNASTGSFIFPVGKRNDPDAGNLYSPAVININSVTVDGQGFITVKPITGVSAGLAEDDDEKCLYGPPHPVFDFVDLENVLQYHWLLRSADITNMEATLQFQYDQSDFALSQQVLDSGFTVDNYGPARLLDASSDWDLGFSNVLLDDANRTITFAVNVDGDPFTTLTSATIAGSYTAGLSVTSGGNPLCEGGAFPPTVPLFETFPAFTSGNYNNADSYVDGVAPSPSISPDLLVAGDFTLDLNMNNVRFRKVTIEEGATLSVDGTIGHRLGLLSGTGTLRIAPAVEDGLVFPNFEPEQAYPAADCSGGGLRLEFAGAVNYAIPSLSTVRRITFSGTGERRMEANESMLVCENLVISNGTGLRFSDTGPFIFDVKGDAILQAGGNIIDNNDNSEIYFTSSSSQLIQGNFSGGNALSTLRVDKPNQNLTVAGAVEVKEQLRLNSGNINTTGVNSLRMLNGATYGSGNDEYGASSYVNGPLIRQLSEAAFSTEFPFAVGASGRYGRIDVMGPRNYAPSGNKDWTVQYYAYGFSHDVLTQEAIDAGIENASENEHWRVNVPSDAASDLRLTWNSSSNVESEISNMRVVRWTGAAWDSIKHVAGGAPTGTVAAGSHTAGLFTFSEILVTNATINAAETPLPVEMLYLRGRESDGMVELAWATASEIDNHFFEVQRSQDGKEWKVIGYVDGNGTTNIQQSYEFLDPNPFVGLSYYRLRQVDFDGQYEHTDIISVMLRLDDFSYTIYPNPVREIFTIEVRGVNAYEDLDFKIINLNGSILEKGIIGADDSGRVSKEMNVSQLIPGFYILIFESSDRAFKFNLLKK